MNEKLPVQSRTDSNAQNVSATKPTALSPASMSTGPRTAAGKVIASRNGIKHGIFAKVMHLTSASRAQYNSLASGLREHFRPEGALEEFFVEKLAVQVWRSRQLVDAVTTEIEEAANSEYDRAHLPEILDRFSRYETSIDRSFDRTLTQLERCQRMRKGQQVAPPIWVDVSS